MSEPRAVAEKRLLMRSMRRGMKEMDLILTPFSRQALAGMSESELAGYDRLLSENDQELYTWVTGQVAPPPEFQPLIEKIRSSVNA